MKRLGVRSPGRRTEAIPEEDWDPVPWENDLPFRILSMDGGGIRGIFPAAVLAYLEQEHLQGKSIGNYFDLIAGTSTGGMISCSTVTSSFDVNRWATGDSPSSSLTARDGSGPRRCGRWPGATTGIPPTSASRGRQIRRTIDQRGLRPRSLMYGARYWDAADHRRVHAGRCNSCHVSTCWGLTR